MSGRLSDRPPIQRLSAERARALYDAHSAELLAFLVGVLRDLHAAQDVSQTVFRRLLEVGHTAKAETIKGWLFTVATREALAYRRNTKRDAEILSRYSWSVRNGEADDDILVKEEDVTRLKELLARLPPEQQEMVRQRMVEEKAFAVIATELNLPLGTVLTRVRLAMEKLRAWMKDE